MRSKFIRTIGILHMTVLLCWLQNLPFAPPPVEEFRFHPTRKWRFDFAWPERKIALEIEGGTWVAGRHTRGKGYESDCQKYNEAAILGWLVIRATTNIVRKGEVIGTLQRAFEARKGWYESTRQ